MHIGFITGEYPHPSCQGTGGIGTSIHNLAQGIVKLGHQCTVFVNGQDADERFSIQGITLIKIHCERRTFLNWLFVTRKLDQVIHSYHEKAPIDILEVPDWGGRMAFSMCRIPKVVKIHGSDTYFCNLEDRKQKPKNRLIESLNFRRGNGIIGVSRFSLDHSARLFKHIRKKKQTVIANGVNPSMFEGLTFGESNDVEPRILYFGTIIRKKGIFDIAHIFNLLVQKFPSAKLILMGRDSGDAITGNKSTIQMVYSSLTAEAKCQTEYLGEKDLQDACSEIKAATLCVFPSRAEAFPMVNLEAMGMGKVVITTNSGWADELIEHGVSGYLIHPEDHEGYVDAIVHLIRNPSEMARVGLAAHRRVVADFAHGYIAEKHIEFYRTILEGK
ncbi:glycosyltransferase family 4 protein [Akkermansiaceae bacterium]|nr:glycosyltransferase family 4 protein [Akkermansiaceae bacterium]